jgi:hypothetical protein
MEVGVERRRMEGKMERERRKERKKENERMRICRVKISLVSFSTSTLFIECFSN